MLNPVFSKQISLNDENSTELVMDELGSNEIKDANVNDDINVNTIFSTNLDKDKDKSKKSKKNNANKKKSIVNILDFWLINLTLKFFDRLSNFFPQKMKTKLMLHILILRLKKLSKTR